MKAHYAVGFFVALVIATTLSAQEHTQFNDHDRQVANDWYKEHHSHAPSGLRERDRLTSDEESRLQPGRVLPPDLRRRTHSVPSELRRKLPPPPRNHEYLAVGLHVALVNSKTHEVRDVIHLHEH